MRRLSALFVLLVTLSLPVPSAAQETPQTVFLLEQGFFYAYKNELALFTTKAFNDPVKLRMGNWVIDSYLAIVSANLLSGDEQAPRQDERAFFGIRHNDSRPKTENAQEFVVNITDSGCSGVDACQKVRLRLTEDFLELFGRRVDLTQPPATDHLLASSTGIYIQPDGNVVVYQWVNGTPCPRWALNWLNATHFGFVDRTVLAPPCNAPPTPGMIFN